MWGTSGYFGSPQYFSVLSSDPDTTRRPSGNTATPLTYDEDTSSQKYSERRATHAVRNSRHDRNSRHNHALPTMTTVHFRASD